METLDLVYQETSDSKARHIPGRPNVVADRLSRLGQTIQTVVFSFQRSSTLCSRWHRPKINLFATRFNNKSPLFCVTGTGSPGHSSGCAQSAMVGSKSIHLLISAILGKVVEKLQDSPCKRIILIAPGWPNMPWFWDLVAMSSHIPLSLPNLSSLFTAIRSDPSQKSDKA